MRVLRHDDAYVLDLNRAEQIGVRLGFDQSDALEYYVFTGRGEWVGQIAQFEPFGDVGTKIALGNRQLVDGEGRPARLPADEDQSDDDEAEVDAAIAKSATVFPETHRWPATSCRRASFLIGKELTLRYDHGLAIEYRFDEIQKLRWRRVSGLPGGALAKAGKARGTKSATNRGRPRPASSCSAICSRCSESRRVLDRGRLRPRARDVPARHDGHAVHRERSGGQDASSV